MERRDFFKWGFTKVADMAVQEAEARANKSASRWIRPPFAVAELDFLIKCTRCEACIEACPYEVLFPLSTKFGLQFAATPAMDLLNKGCHMCADWPCVNACEPNALKLPDASNLEDAASQEDTENLEDTGTDDEQRVVTVTPPLLAAASIDKTVCLPYLGPECGACSGSCPIPGALVWDKEKPHIDSEHCTGCALCREACIAAPKAVVVQNLARAAGHKPKPTGAHRDKLSTSDDANT